MTTLLATGRRIKAPLPIITALLWILQFGLLVRVSRLFPSSEILEREHGLFFAMAICVVLCAGAVIWLGIQGTARLSRMAMFAVLAMPSVGIAATILAYYILRFTFSGFSL